MANLRVMRDPVSMEFLLSGHINDAWYWAHALANFQMPTLPPGGTPVPASPVGQVVELLIDDEVFAIAKCLDACVDGHLARVQVEEVVWDYEEDAYLPYGPSDARTVAQYILLEPLPDLWWPIALLRIRIEALADSDSDDGLSGSESCLSRCVSLRPGGARNDKKLGGAAPPPPKRPYAAASVRARAARARGARAAAPLRARGPRPASRRAAQRRGGTRPWDRRPGAAATAPRAAGRPRHRPRGRDPVGRAARLDTHQARASRERRGGGAGARRLVGTAAPGSASVAPRPTLSSSLVQTRRLAARAGRGPRAGPRRPAVVSPPRARPARGKCSASLTRPADPRRPRSRADRAARTAGRPARKATAAGRFCRPLRGARDRRLGPFQLASNARRSSTERCRAPVSPPGARLRGARRAPCARGPALRSASLVQGCPKAPSALCDPPRTASPRRATAAARKVPAGHFACSRDLALSDARADFDPDFWAVRREGTPMRPATRASAVRLAGADLGRRQS